MAGLDDLQRIMTQSTQGGSDQRQLINQFAFDPERQREVEGRIHPGLNDAQFRLGQSARRQALSGANQFAQTGNIGGSAQMNAEARLQGQVNDRAGALQEQSLIREQQMQQAIEQQRQAEIAQSFGLDPFTLQAIQTTINQIRGQGDRARALGAADLQRRRQESFANDEFSRSIGGALNTFGQGFRGVTQANALNNAMEV